MVFARDCCGPTAHDCASASRAKLTPTPAALLRCGQHRSASIRRCVRADNFRGGRAALRRDPDSILLCFDRTGGSARATSTVALLAAPRPQLRLCRCSEPAPLLIRETTTVTCSSPRRRPRPGYHPARSPRARRIADSAAWVAGSSRGLSMRVMTWETRLCRLQGLRLPTPPCSISGLSLTLRRVPSSALPAHLVAPRAGWGPPRQLAFSTETLRHPSDRVGPRLPATPATRGAADLPRGGATSTPRLSTELSPPRLRSSTRKRSRRRGAVRTLLCSRPGQLTLRLDRPPAEARAFAFRDSGRRRSLFDSSRRNGPIGPSHRDGAGEHAPSIGASTTPLSVTWPEAHRGSPPRDQLLLPAAAQLAVRAATGLTPRSCLARGFTVACEASARRWPPRCVGPRPCRSAPIARASGSSTSLCPTCGPGAWLLDREPFDRRNHAADFHSLRTSATGRGALAAGPPELRSAPHGSALDAAAYVATSIRQLSSS